MIIYGFFPGGEGGEGLVLLASVVLLVWPVCRICSRAGFPWPMGLLMLIPLLNLVLLYILAFAEWPALRDRKPAETREL